jgi:magnesium transporter
MMRIVSARSPTVERPRDEDKAQPRRRRSRLHYPHRKDKGPGASAGIELDELARMPSGPSPVHVTCIDFDSERLQVRVVEDFDTFLAEHRPDWSAVRWIDVDGLSDPRIIHGLAAKYNLHPLAIEDVLHVGQRPKLESYHEQDGLQARLFLVLRMLRLVGERLQSEQISIFLGHSTVLTFQEDPGDVWDPIRRRLDAKDARLREQDASFLVYALIDAIVDHCFPILEAFGDRLEAVEDLVLERPSPDTLRQVRIAKRELLLLRHSVWPMREVIGSLLREPHPCMSDPTRTYLRDVYDHVVQIIDIVEAYRELATGLTDSYMTSMSHRLNEVMKVLTIVGTIFIPMTFLAGVYGMNFKYIPEMDEPWAYPAFWVVCLTLAVGMLAWFRRRGWL